MARKILSHEWEIGSTETLKWSTDVISSINRDEQRISLLEYPDEIVDVAIKYDESGTFAIEGQGALNGQDSIVNSLSDLIECEGEIELPMWHLADTIQITGTNWNTGTRIATISFSSAFTPFETKVGEFVLVLVGSTWRKAEVVDYNVIWVQVDFGSNTGAAIASLRKIVPLRNGLAQSTSQTLVRWANSADIRITARLERGERVGFGTSYTLNTSSSFDWPIVELRGFQDSLSIQVESGNELINTPTNFPYYVTRWSEAALRFSYANEFNRYSTQYRFWRQLFTTTRGSQKPFWVPTRRSDFEILAMVGVAGIRLRGRQFFDLWTSTNIKALCLDSGSNPICVRVAATCELDGEDTVVGFDEDLPWANPVIQCSLAFPCRLDGDTVQFKHDRHYSEISFSLTNVNVTYSQGGSSPVDANLLAHIDNSSSYAKFDRYARYSQVTNEGTIGGLLTPINEGPSVSVLNSLRAMAFNSGEFDPTGFGLDAFLWVDTDQLTIDNVDEFGFFDGPPAIRYVASSATPWPIIVKSGVLGESRWALTNDGITPFGVSRSTKPEDEMEGLRVFFENGTYNEGDFWQVKVSGFIDSIGGNDLTSIEIDPQFLPMLNPVTGFVETADSSRFARASLVGGREVSGPMTVVLVGSAGAIPGSRILFQGGSGQRRLETDSGGAPRLVSGGTSATVGTIVGGDKYLIVAVYNGAASQIHLLKNTDGTWSSGTVNDGGAATNDFDQVQWGATNHFCQALFVAEGVPNDIEKFKEGMAMLYGFANQYANTAVQITPEVSNDWSVLHDNSASYVMSLVLRIDEPSAPIVRMLNLLNDAENGGFRLDWLRDSDEMHVEWIGSSGSFEQDFSIGATSQFVFEIRYSQGVGAECFLDGNSIGSFVPSGFTFQSAQDNPLFVGRDSGFTFCEMIVRLGSTLQYESLLQKWASALESMVTESIDVMVTESGSLMVVEY